MFLFFRDVWFLTFSKTLQPPPPIAALLLQEEPNTPDSWSLNQGTRLSRSLLVWSGSASEEAHCDCRSYLCLWIHASYGGLLPSRETFKFRKWKLLRWPNRSSFASQKNRATHERQGPLSSAPTILFLEQTQKNQIKCSNWHLNVPNNIIHGSSPNVH